MSQTPVSKALRRTVAREAQYRCGYCLCSDVLIGMPMEFDHLVPECQDGPTVRGNLWLACPQCNWYKGGRISARDPLTRKQVALFNPRRDHWRDHFRWIRGGLQIEGISPIGRATVAALKINLPMRVRAREVWIAAGRYPPIS